MENIKKIKKNEVEAFTQIMINAYPGFAAKEKDRLNLFKGRIDRLRKTKNNALFAYFENRKMLGIMRLLDFEMRFRGKDIKAGGIGLVGVDMMNKKRRIAKKMMKFYLDHYEKRKYYFALLYPFRPDFYKKMGFGYGSRSYDYKINPLQIRDSEHRKFVKEAIVKNGKDILNCYEKFRHISEGLIKRDIDGIKSLMKSEKMKKVIYEEKGKISGYMLYHFSPEDDKNEFRNNIIVKELIYLKSRTLQGLMAFLRSQADQAEHIIFHSQDENLFYMFNDIRYKPAKFLTNGPHHITSESGNGIMYRIINPIKFFNSFKGKVFNVSKPITVSFEISDIFMNNSKYRFTIAFDKNGHKIIKENADLKISMDIAEFSSMIVGAVDLKTLYKYGLAEIKNSGKIDEINNIFRTADKPLCLTDF